MDLGRCSLGSCRCYCGGCSEAWWVARSIWVWQIWWSWLGLMWLPNSKSADAVTVSLNCVLEMDDWPVISEDLDHWTLEGNSELAEQIIFGSHCNLSLCNLSRDGSMQGTEQAFERSCALCASCLPSGLCQWSSWCPWLSTSGFDYQEDCGDLDLCVKSVSVVPVMVMPLWLMK